MFLLDHLAIVCADLDEGCRWAEARLGVPFQAGGTHEKYGTHNRLLGLADGLYLEVIAPNPKAIPHGPRWFGLDDAPSEPRLGNWICQASSLSDYHDIAGPAVALTRGDLAWNITVPDDGNLPLDGGFPTLIEWGDAGGHPSKHLPDSGLCLMELCVMTPDAERVTMSADTFDPRVKIVSAPKVALQARFKSPRGMVVLG